MSAPPTKVAHYEVRETLGAGGLGTVYKAWDTKLNRVVALKVLSDEIQQPELRKHFHLEARTIAALQHPHIVRVLDFADAGAEPQFIALEHLGGASWGDILEEHGPATEQAALCIGRQVAAAIAYAHAQNIVHRDIKPDNVILEPDRAVLIDFGAIKLLDTHELIPDSHISGERRMTIGTVGFMAPEQIGSDDMDERVDIFALGGLLYKATTGLLPYYIDTEDVRALRREVKRNAYRDPRDVQPLLTPAFCDLLADCLAPNPKDRIATAVLLVSRIDKLLAAHGISVDDVRVELARYVAAPSLDHAYDLRTVDSLLRELRLALLRDLHRAVQRQDDEAITWSTARLRYFSSLFGEAERYFILGSRKKPRLLRDRKQRRGRWFALGLVLGIALAAGVALSFPDWTALVADALAARMTH